MSKASKCPQCGQPLPDNAPAGLCPHCLMALNLKTETVFTDDAPAAQPPLPPEQIAPHFPQLEILECLGRGGMGVVYQARQKTLNRMVALKLLAPERVGDVKFAGRFTREAQALAALNHPNIVTIYDFGQAGGFYFLLMDFVDGANLRQLLRTRKFTPEEALAIVPSLCDALQFAHERGIVHRDIKPENLLLDKAGRIKVADFGIAKMLGAINGSSEGEAQRPENATHSAVGTPGYSAPEQKTDPQRVDNRADIYSLGVVFYEMLTGELPGKQIAPPSTKVHIDVRLDEIVLRALEKKPELRYQQASAMKTQVETITGGAHAANIQPVPITLNQKRFKIMAWGLALAVAGAAMNLYLGILGSVLFIIVTVMAWVFGQGLKTQQMASRLIALEGMVMAASAIWYACNTSEFPLALAGGHCHGVFRRHRVCHFLPGEPGPKHSIRIAEPEVLFHSVADYPGHPAVGPVFCATVSRGNGRRRAGDPPREPFPGLEIHAYFCARRPHRLPFGRVGQRGASDGQRRGVCGGESDGPGRPAGAHERDSWQGGQCLLAGVE